jgi:hypothetical protein
MSSKFGSLDKSPKSDEVCLIQIQKDDAHSRRRQRAIHSDEALDQIDVLEESMKAFAAPLFKKFPRIWRQNANFPQKFILASSVEHEFLGLHVKEGMTTRSSLPGTFGSICSLVQSSRIGLIVGYPSHQCTAARGENPAEVRRKWSTRQGKRMILPPHMQRKYSELLS